MSRILIIYSTTDGHTLKICQRLQQVIESRNSGQHVTLIPVEDCHQVDLRTFDKIVIGASIRYGKHSPKVIDCINRNLPLLESKPNAFFSVNIVARKPEKNQPETNPYLQQVSQTYRLAVPGNWRCLPASWTIRNTARLTVS